MFAALLLLAAAGAAEPQAAYDAGVAAARAGEPAVAEAHFVEAVTEGGRDPAAFHALGNARFRQGEVGAALAAWRQGQRLDPRNGDLAANIDRVRRESADRIDPPSDLAGPFFWLGFLSLADAAWLAGLLGLVGGGGLVARELIRRRGRAVRRAGAETAVGLGGALLFGVSVVLAGGRETVVVTADEVAARSALGPDGIELFVLHEAAEVAAVEWAQDHVLVALPDERKGWLPASVVRSTDPNKGP